MPEHPDRPPAPRRDRRLAAGSSDAAAGLPLPPAVPLRDAGLLGGRAAGGDVQRCASRLPPVSAGERRPPGHDRAAECDRAERAAGRGTAGAAADRGSAGMTDARDAPAAGDAAPPGDELYRIEDLTVHFPIRGGLLDTILRRATG